MIRTITYAYLSITLGVSFFETSARAATFAAQVNVTGTDDATTAATVLHQSPGPTLEVATMTPNFGDLSLLLGGSAMSQTNGVVLAHPNQFQYASVSNRNIIEAPGEVSTGAAVGLSQRHLVVDDQRCGGRS